MSTYHNTLFVTTPGAYLAKDYENVLVRVEHVTRMSVPLHHLGGVVCLGPVSASPELMAACAERGIGLSFLDGQGRFLARVEGPASGNVLLRRIQFRLADEPAACARLARGFVIGKVANARSLLVRSAREQRDETRSTTIHAAASRLADRLVDLGRTDSSLETVRGHEGEAAASYFSAFDAMIPQTVTPSDSKPGREGPHWISSIRCFRFATRCFVTTAPRRSPPPALTPPSVTFTPTGPAAPRCLWT